ncbi:caspase family protein [Pseudobacteriovorax antillogorgiicola]|uniref:Caspase domain-containing protein n=1 Tax=Pseudobacteriovorax antillogorgiicola TaxID=1513793 RepID=A0A1Y6BQS2_9BACT|nr:caspase family protein [Pseudobacteriovorax antillogorgiicola]TCS54715.1 caspase domain-containing protein [Pseudobacteriovorax antillogorgiicola]SMF16085.1 Caspase domain-containing protein [Pseudobacteriovorax antillogorgiicola]
MNNLLHLKTWMPYLLLSLFFSIQVRAESQSKRLLLSVGISSFESDLFHPLRYSKKDAGDISSFFENTASPKFDRIEQLSGDHAAKVNRNEVLRAFQRLDEQNRLSTDIVMIYLSTHGTVGLDDAGKVKRFLVTSDTDPNNLQETALGYDEIVNRFRSLKSRKKVLILDFCYSGVGKSRLTMPMLKKLATLKSDYFSGIDDESVEGEYILTASGPSQPAQESSVLKNGVYTHFLIEGFRQDLNGDGAVSLAEAHNYARKQTYEFTKGQQTPTFRIRIEGSEPIFVTGHKPSKSLFASIYSFWKGHRKFKLFVNGVDKGALSQGAKLAPGRSHIRVINTETGKTEVDKYFDFSPDKEYPAIMLFQKYYSWQFQVGTEFSRWLSSVDPGYGDSVGVYGKLRRKHVLGAWNLGFKFGYDQARDSLMESYADDSGSVNYSQKRSTFRGQVLVGSHRKFSLGSLTQSKAVGTAVLEAGPILEHAAINNSKFEISDQEISWGLGMNAQTEILLPLYGFNIGAGLKLDIVRNYLGDGPFIARRGGFEFYIGQSF